MQCNGVQMQELIVVGSGSRPRCRHPIEVHTVIEGVTFSSRVGQYRSSQTGSRSRVCCVVVICTSALAGMSKR